MNANASSSDLQNNNNSLPNNNNRGIVYQNQHTNDVRINSSDNQDNASSSSSTRLNEENSVQPNEDNDYAEKDKATNTDNSIPTANFDEACVNDTKQPARNIIDISDTQDEMITNSSSSASQKIPIPTLPVLLRQQHVTKKLLLLIIMIRIKINIMIKQKILITVYQQLPLLKRRIHQ